MAGRSMPHSCYKSNKSQISHLYHMLPESLSVVLLVVLGPEHVSVTHYSYQRTLQITLGVDMTHEL